MISCAAFAALLATVLAALSLRLDGKARMYWPRPEWTLDDIPLLEGQTALVTGANTGLGYATSLELLKHGARVIVATRSVEKNAKTVERLQAEKDLPAKYRANAVAPMAALELSSLESVAEFAEHIKETESKLDMLINNAAVVPIDFTLSKDGIELQLAVSHVAHYALTLRLLPLLEAGAPARVATVSSVGHKFAPGPDGFDFDNLNNPAKYETMPAYGRSKLANILFTRALARRVQEKGIFVNALHPGLVATDIFREVVAIGKRTIGEKATTFIVGALENAIFLSPRQGATTQLFLAMPLVAERNITGEYYMPMARKHDSNPFALSQSPTELAMDDALAEKLWAWTAETTGLDI